MKQTNSTKIIHKMVYHKYDKELSKGKLTLRKMYLCNQAVKPPKDKLNLHWKHVTCKNCLKQKEKYMLKKYGRKNARKQWVW